MILVNTDYVPGRELELLGLVQGNTIQSKNIGRDFTQGLRQIVGGELKAYTDMMSKAREEAVERMVKEAEALGADAVVNVRFASAAVMAGAAEILAYGTAVRFKECGRSSGASTPPPAGLCTWATPSARCWPGWTCGAWAGVCCCG